MAFQSALLLAVALGGALAGCLSGGEAPPPPAAVRCLTDALATPATESASEVSLAIDPTDPDHIVAAANSAGGFGVYTSLDGGANWAAELVDGLALLGPQAAAIALSDPALAFAPDGTLHMAGLAYIPTSQVFVASRATPTGPWTAHTVWQSEIAATFNDKEWLGIDPVTGTMIVAWQREPAMDSLRTVEQTLMGAADLDLGLIVMSRSMDAGVTWSLPQQVSGSSLHNNGTQVAFTSDGRAHIVWVDYEVPGLVHAISTDGGVTWSDPSPIADLHIAHAFGAFARMHTLPGLAQHEDGLAVVWHDAGADAADILLATYDGKAWSEAQRVPDDGEGSGRVQVYPWAAIDGEGALHVTYYSGEVDGLFTYRAATLRDGAWGSPVDLGPVFDLVDANGSVADLGDYTAAAAVGSVLHAAWSQPDAERNARVHVATVRSSMACAADRVLPG